MYLNPRYSSHGGAVKVKDNKRLSIAERSSSQEVQDLKLLGAQIARGHT